MRITAALFPLLLVAVAVSSCRSSGENDPPSDDGVPPVTGTGLRIRDLVNPTLPNHASMINATESISGAIVIAIDTYDETANGKGTGTIYIQDVDATKDTPYAGINLYGTSFTPGNLRVSPGDVLDMTGEYQESPSVSTVTFAPGTALIQLYLPDATFRFETALPEPIDIDASILTDYNQALKYIGMLVRVSNVTPTDALYASKGRQSIDMSTAGATSTSCSDPFPKPWQIANDLTDLTPFNFTSGTTIKSVTGVLGFFCNVQLYPRFAADVQL